VLRTKPWEERRWLEGNMSRWLELIRVHQSADPARLGSRHWTTSREVSSPAGPAHTSSSLLNSFFGFDLHPCTRKRASMLYKLLSHKKSLVYIVVQKFIPNQCGTKLHKLSTLEFHLKWVYFENQFLIHPLSILSV